MATCTVGVLVLCASLYAAPVQAQTTFISNLDMGQLTPTGFESISDTTSFAQSFRTGGNSAGYTLHSVWARLGGSADRITTLVAEVRTDTTDGETGDPSSTVVATLSAPSPLSATTTDTVELTAPSNTMLQPNTTYHLVLMHQQNINLLWQHTGTTVLDAGTAMGWSFPQGGQESSDGGSSWGSASTSENLLMNVRGTALTDTTPPTLDTAAVNGDTLTLTYDEALDTASTPAATAFTLGGTSETVSTVAISGSVVTLNLSGAVTSGDSVTLTYTPGANPVQDVAGNDAAALSAQAVTNNTPPMLVRTGNRRPGVGGILLRLRYDDALDESSVPDAGDFTLGGTMPTVSEVDISGRDVLLTLSAPVSSTDTVTVTYMPGTNPVQDEDGNDVAAFTDVSVLNVTPPVPAGSVTAFFARLGRVGGFLDGAGRHQRGGHIPSAVPH